jgi:K+-sensing histidine kinase KdpD
VDTVRQVLDRFTIPQQLLLLSAVTYAGVFAILRAYGHPGMGIGQGFFIAVILAAAATSPVVGALSGVVALFLYELAIHQQPLAWHDFTQAQALTRLASFVAVGALTGFLARRSRLMLAQSFHVLEDLIEIASARVEQAGDDAASASSDVRT